MIVAALVGFLLEPAVRATDTAIAIYYGFTILLYGITEEDQ